MKHGNASEAAVTIGIDLGDKHSQVCELDAQGEVIEESKIRTTAEAVGRRFSSMTATRIAVETGTHSNWIADQLRSMGHEVVVANARKLRAIYQSDREDGRFAAPIPLRGATVRA